MLNNDEERQKEYLVRDLGIFELRALAREFGIPSPTTKKREELINLILDMLKSGKNIDHLGKRKGRPFKRLSSIDDIICAVNNDGYGKLSQTVEFDSLITFAQEVPVFVNLGEETRIFKGIVRQSGKFYNIFDYELNKWACINEKLNGIEKIRLGDKLEVEAKGNSEDNQFQVVKINKINGIDFDDYEKKFFDKGKEIISNDNIPFAEGNAKVGRRNTYKISEDLYENNNFVNLIDYCHKSDITLVVLGLNTSFENQIYFNSCEGIENFTTEFGTNCLYNFNKVTDAILFSQNLVNQGKKVVLFIVDVVDVLRALDECFLDAKEENKHTEQTLVIAKKLLSIGRAYENCCSNTMIICYNQVDMEDRYLVNDILKISKNI